MSEDAKLRYCGHCGTTYETRHPGDCPKCGCDNRVGNERFPHLQQVNELQAEIERLRAENQRLTQAVRSYASHHPLNLKSPRQIQYDLLAICGDKHMHVAGRHEECAICQRNFRDDVHIRAGEGDG